MASIIPIGGKRRAQVCRRGHPARTKTFETKILAEKRARRVEADIDAGRAGVLPKGAMPIRALIHRYKLELEDAKPLGRNKADVSY
jgi:hypothetical protein